MLETNVHMMANLAIVLLAILGFLLALKKFKFGKAQSNQYMKLINIMPVGQKEKMLLVEVNNVVLLLGATPSHIETLYVFDGLKPLGDAPVAENQKGFISFMKAAAKVR